MNPTQFIDETIKNNKVVLFMKGTKHQPACGFSAKAAQILTYLGVEFQDVNVLEDLELREAVKAKEDWPTIPMIFINQEFIGGCDILTELFQSGELQKKLGMNA